MIGSLLFLACSLLSSTTHSDTTHRTFAVVVGVSDYKLGLPGKGDLEYSDDDARGFSALLQSQAGGNVPSENIRLLIDQNASHTRILQAMTIFQQATPNDRIIFFFSGHGDSEMFLPYDGAPGKELWHTTIKAAFRQSVAGTKLLLADACMSGSITRKVYPQALHPADTSATHSTASSHHSTSNVVVMLSSHYNQVSQENRRLHQGAFTYYLIKGARGAADTSPSDGIVTIKELHYYVWYKLRAIAGTSQTPNVFGNFPDDLAFTSSSR